MLASSIALADAPSYNYIQATYDNYKENDWVAIEGDIRGVEGSVEVTNNIFIRAGTSAGDFDSHSSNLDTIVKADVSFINMNVGFFLQANENTTMHTSIGYQRFNGDAKGYLYDYYYEEYTYSENKHKDTSLVFDAGIRSNITDDIELNGGFKYVDYDDRNLTTVTVGVLLNTDSGIGAGLNYSRGNDSTQIISAVIRYTF